MLVLFCFLLTLLNLLIINLSCFNFNLAADGRLSYIFVSNKHYTNGLFVIIYFPQKFLIDLHVNVFYSFGLLVLDLLFLIYHGVLAFDDSNTFSFFSLAYLNAKCGVFGVVILFFLVVLTIV